MKAGFKMRIYLVAFLLAVCSLVVMTFFIKSPATAMLPDSASHVDEYSSSFLFASDFTRCVTANIDIDGFNQYVKNLKMIYFSSNVDIDEPPSFFWESCPLSSWKERRKKHNDTDMVFIDPNSGGDYYAMARYSDGYVYFMAMSW